MLKNVLLIMLMATTAVAGGYIPGPGATDSLPTAAFVYAKLPTATDTTIPLADTYYEISGPFDNSIIQGFDFIVDHIELLDGPARYFEIDWHTSVEATPLPNQTIHVGVRHNTDPVTGIMGTLCKTAGEAYAFSGSVVLWLEVGDEIQLTVSSSIAASIVKFNHLHTTIRPFVEVE